MTDFGWDPNWIMAGTSILTLGAAIVAGRYAAKAAHWTRKQAEAGNEQVRIASDALAVAQGEAHEAHVANDRQQEEAAAAYRRFAESRLDSLVPVVFGVARPVGTCLQVRRKDGSGQWTGWHDVTESHEETGGVDVVYRTTVNVELRNVSNQIARVAVVENANGENTLPPGEFTIPPGGTKSYTWTRHLTPVILETQEAIDDQKNWLFNQKLWVRDLGANVRDTYVFSGDLRFFGRDGSRLTITVPQSLWDENVAVPLRERVYERLVAEDMAASDRSPNT